MAILHAGYEVKVLRIIAEHLEVSDIGKARILEALLAIRRALAVKRAELGLAET